MEDSRIVDLYFGRNEEAIAESDAKYGRYCRSISRNILGSLEDAMECVNDTWLHAWNAIPPFRPLNLGTYLGKITRNLSLNRYEAQHAARRGGSMVDTALDELEECLPDETGSPEEQRENAQIGDAINAFLERLPQQKRNMFVERYFYMSSITEIAKVQGMKESAVKMQLLRMRTALRRELEEQGIVL